MSEEPPSTKVEITVVAHDPAWQALLARAERIAHDAARAVLRHDGSERAGAGPRPAPAELTLVLADDRLVRTLNRDYRGQDKPTNVLSFADLDGPAEAVPEAPALLGDVVLARETIVREAEEQGKTTADHLAHLVVHGVLHLLGHDHRSAREAAEMERLERAVLADIGVADPYRERAVAAAALGPP